MKKIKATEVKSGMYLINIGLVYNVSEISHYIKIAIITTDMIPSTLYLRFLKAAELYIKLKKYE